MVITRRMYSGGRRFMRSSFKFFLQLAAVILLVAVSISSGCSSEEDADNATLKQIDSLEKAADNRLLVMDFSSPDEIFYSQVTASEEQYKEAIDMLYTLGPTFTLNGFSYEARLKSLQFKADFLDVLNAISETDEKAENIFKTSTPEFREGLIEVIDDYENIRGRILFLQVMGRDIDKTLIDSEYTKVLSTIRSELDLMLDSVDSKISFLMEYR